MNLDDGQQVDQPAEYASWVRSIVGTDNPEPIYFKASEIADALDQMIAEGMK